MEVLPDEYERELETIDVYIAKIDCKQTNPLLKYVLFPFCSSFFAHELLIDLYKSIYQH